MKRKMVFALTLALVFVMMAGALPSAAQDSGVEILVWMTGSENDAVIAQAAADVWAEATGNKVVIEPVDWGTAHARILTAATSGEGPDIITGGLSWGIEFGELGGMIDLAAAYPEDVAAIQEADNPGMWGSITSRDGAVYGVPYDLTVYFFYNRPDVLAEMGLEVPDTWEDLVAVQDAIIEAKGEGGFADNWSNTQWLGFSNFLWQAGGDFYDEDCNVTIDSDEAVEALEFYAALYTEHGATTESSSALEAGLDSGLYPIAQGGSWVVGGLDAGYPDMVGKWKISPLPAGPTGKRTTFIGGRVMGVMSFSKNPDQAFDLIKFLNTQEAAQILIDESAKLNALFIPPQVEFLPLTAFGDNVRDTVVAQLADAQGPPNCTGWEVSAPDVTLAIQSVIFEGADAEDALAEAAASMEANGE